MSVAFSLPYWRRQRQRINGLTENLKLAYLWLWCHIVPSGPASPSLRLLESLGFRQLQRCGGQIGYAMNTTSELVVFIARIVHIESTLMLEEMFRKRWYRRPRK
jgi:hypothetical protein